MTGVCISLLVLFCVRCVFLYISETSDRSSFFILLSFYIHVSWQTGVVLYNFSTTWIDKAQRCRAAFEPAGNHGNITDGSASAGETDQRFFACSTSFVKSNVSEQWAATKWNCKQGHSPQHGPSATREGWFLRFLTHKHFWNACSVFLNKLAASMLLKTTHVVLCVTWQTGNCLTVGVTWIFGLINGFTGQKKSLKTPEIKHEDSSAFYSHLSVRRWQSGDERELRCSLIQVFLGRVIPRREAADGALTRRRAATADEANEAVGSLAANWAVSAKTGVRHLFVTEEHLVASRPSTGPSLSLWCDINSSSSQTERKMKKENGEKWQTNWRLRGREHRGVKEGGGDTKRPAEEESARSS